MQCRVSTATRCPAEVLRGAGYVLLVAAVAAGCGTGRPASVAHRRPPHPILEVRLVPLKTPLAIGDIDEPSCRAPQKGPFVRLPYAGRGDPAMTSDLQVATTPALVISSAEVADVQSDGSMLDGVTLHVSLDPKGAKAFDALTRRLRGCEVAFVAEGKVLSAVALAEEIRDGRITLPGLPKAAASRLTASIGLPAKAVSGSVSDPGVTDAVFAALVSVVAFAVIALVVTLLAGRSRYVLGLLAAPLVAVLWRLAVGLVERVTLPPPPSTPSILGMVRLFQSQAYAPTWAMIGKEALIVLPVALVGGLAGVVIARLILGRSPASQE